MEITILSMIDPYQTSDHSAQVENGPEREDIATFGCFRWVAEHNLSLGAPEHSSTAAKKKARKYHIGIVFGVVVAQVRGYVDRVAQATERKSCLDAEHVSDTTAAEADDGKSRIESAIGIVASF